MANIEPRHVYVVSFDTANTDLYYFLSHSDIVIDGVASANIFSGVLVNPSTTSQSLNPIRANATIGNISFSFIDQSNDLTSLLNSKLHPAATSPETPAQGLRAKRVQHWVGEKGAEWSSGYNLLQTQQFYQSIGWQDNAYTFNAQDIQRSELTDIFDPKKTTLTASVSLTDNIINVNNATAFERVIHGGAYSDAPNDEVGYIKIEDEIIRYTSSTSTTFTTDVATSALDGAVAENATSIPIDDASSFDSTGYGYVESGSPLVKYPIRWAGKSSNTLTSVSGVVTGFDNGATIRQLKGRGVLGTSIAAHDVDTNKSVDKRTKVTEYIYLEMPAVQLAYAILTGTVYGSSPSATLPSHWNLGISAADWIATSEFISIGTDLWDTSDDTAGFILRFDGLEKTNAKKFIEEQILFIAGLFTPILPTGELGLRRMSGVVSDSAYSRILNESNILNISTIRYDMDDIHNDFLIKWNYNSVNKTYTREVELSDTDSISKWGQARQLEIKSLGLKGSIHTDSIIGNLFNTWRDRHAGPPFKATLQLDYSERTIRIGDIVRLQLSNIPEFTDQNNAYSSLDISVEVQKLSINYKTGVVTVDVFGSTQRASPLVIGNPSLDDTFYTSQGSNLAASPMLVTGTDSGGTLTITGNSSLTGVADLNSATATSDNGQGIFYYDGNLIINAGVTLTISDNVELRVKGTLTNNGVIDGAGQGLAATDDGQAGYIGTTLSGGGFSFYLYGTAGMGYTPVDNYGLGFSSPMDELTKRAPRKAVGQVSTCGPINFVNNDTSISGKPGDLRGSSGGKGGNIYQQPGATLRATGGAGGAGGGGLLIVCRGAAGGVSSSINLSGADGAVGQTNTGDVSVASGTGAGGYPGALVIALDGNTVTETISPYFVATLGDCKTVGYPHTPAGGFNYLSSEQYSQQPWYSMFEGNKTESKATSNIYVHYFTEYQTAETDTTAASSLPIAITVTEQANTQNSINVLGLEISATAPSDTNYKAARIYIRKQSTQGWQYAGEVASGQECVFWVASDGSTYEIKAHSLSTTNIESIDYIERTFTVSNGITTQIGTGSTIISGANVTTNGGLLISGNDLLVYDSSGNVTQQIDLSGTGNFTGIGTTSGSAADEQLIPNNVFDFGNDGWFPVSGDPGSPSLIVSEDSPNAEGKYLLFLSAPGSYIYTSKTMKFIVGKKYRMRIRCAHTGTGTENGFGYGIYWRTKQSGFIEPITPINYDSSTSLRSTAATWITTTFTTYEHDFTATEQWGNLFLWMVGALHTGDVKVPWVEILPWGVLSDTNIGVFINDTTFGNQGIQLDYNSGTPRGYIGNGDKKYLQFDGTDLSIGEEGGILGVASYPDDSTYIHMPVWYTLDSFNITETGSGQIRLNAGALRATVTSSSGDVARCSIRQYFDLAGNDAWDIRRKFKCYALFTSLESTTTVYIVSGNRRSSTSPELANGGFGFYYFSGQWYTYSGTKGNQQTTSVSIASGSVLEAVFDPVSSPQSVKYYDDGSLIATHTTVLPQTSDTQTRGTIFALDVERSSAGSSDDDIYIGEFKYLSGY